MKKSKINKALLLITLSIMSLPALALYEQPTSDSELLSLSIDKNSSAEVFKEQVSDALALTYEMIKNDDQEVALRILNDVIAQFEQRYQLPLDAKLSSKASSDKDIYSIKNAAMEKDAVDLASYWNDILYLKAYTLVELAELKPAIKVLDTAIAYDAKRANSYSELGHIYQVFGDWELAKYNYAQALKVSQYSEPELQVEHKTRALRGLGFVAIEQGELDIAEEYYHKSLVLDPMDEMAESELLYITKLRQQ